MEVCDVKWHSVESWNAASTETWENFTQWYLWGRCWVRNIYSRIISHVEQCQSKAVFLTHNKAQVKLYRDGWKDLLSSVSLFGLVALQLLDDCGCEMWWSYREELTLTHQTRWLVWSHGQRGHLWFFYFCAVSCGGRRIQRFVVNLKHLAWPDMTELQKELELLKPYAKINPLVI